MLLLFHVPMIMAMVITISAKTAQANTTNRRPLELTRGMDASGNINIDFSKTKDDLMIRFRAESQEKMEFIEQFAGELIDSITDIPHVSISFSQDATDPITDLVKQIVPEGQSMLDTKV